jgi:hypothetical protein
MGFDFNTNPSINIHGGHNNTYNFSQQTNVTTDQQNHFNIKPEHNTYTSPETVTPPCDDIPTHPPEQPELPPVHPEPPKEPEAPPVHPEPPKEPEAPPVKPEPPKQPEAPPVKPEPPKQPEKPPVKPEPPKQPEKPPVKPEPPKQPEKPPVQPEPPKQPEPPREIPPIRIPVEMQTMELNRETITPSIPQRKFIPWQKQTIQPDTGGIEATPKTPAPPAGSVPDVNGGVYPKLW